MAKRALFYALSLWRKTRDPNRKCSGGKSLRERNGLSGALSIGRFVVSRSHVCGGRGTKGIQIPRLRLRRLRYLTVISRIRAASGRFPLASCNARSIRDLLKAFILKAFISLW